MKDLKDKIRNCDLTQFKNYDEYIDYVKELVADYLKNNKSLTTDEIFDLLYLEQFDEDEKVYFSNDDGYTYGSIKCYQINEKYYDDEDEDYE